MKIHLWKWSEGRFWLRHFGSGSDHRAYWSLIIGPLEIVKYDSQ